jgi:hypothetical protein
VLTARVDKRMGEAAPAPRKVSDSVARLTSALGAGDAALFSDLAALDWVSVLPNAAAPGFVYLAGACGGLAVGGGGRDLGEAAGRLAGETAETLARLAIPRPSTAPADPAIDALWGTQRQGSRRGACPTAPRSACLRRDPRSGNRAAGLAPAQPRPRRGHDRRRGRPLLRCSNSWSATPRRAGGRA